MKLLAKINVLLNIHWKPQSSYYIYLNLSPEIQNEFFVVVSKVILALIKTEFKAAKFCSIIADSTTMDISKIAQVSICFCYVQDTCGIVDLFVCVKNVDNSKSETLCNVISEMIQDLSTGLQFCRRQAYDEASSVWISFGCYTVKDKNSSSKCYFCPLLFS